MIPKSLQKYVVNKESLSGKAKKTSFLEWVKKCYRQGR
jgi:hypothetical protein